MVQPDGDGARRPVPAGPAGARTARPQLGRHRHHHPVQETGPHRWQQRGVQHPITVCLKNVNDCYTVMNYEI